MMDAFRQAVANRRFEEIGNMKKALVQRYEALGDQAEVIIRYR